VSTPEQLFEVFRSRIGVAQVLFRSFGWRILASCEETSLPTTMATKARVS